MFNGTSMASPQAAGAAALLVSAAKAAGYQHQPDQLRQAMNSSARFIENYQAYEQGNGLIRVSQAWDLLKTNAKTVDISSSVAVNTVLSGFLATPAVGTGIYDREGVKAGDSYTRTYTLTRTNGGGGTKTYAVSWVGNDGTFESGTSVSLPLGKPVTFPVAVHPTTSGIHSAVMRLDDAANPGVEAETMNTVVAADQFTAANGYSVSKKRHGLPQPVGELLRPRPRGHAGVQGRPAGWRRCRGCRPDPVPSVPPVRRRSREQLDTELVQPTGVRAAPRTAPRPRRPAGPPRTRRRACGRSRSRCVGPLTPSPCRTR